MNRGITRPLLLFALFLQVGILPITGFAMTASAPYLENAGAETTITVRFAAKNAGSAEETPRFAVGYWSIRGLSAPLRMMLCAAKVDHTVFLYDLVENGEQGWKAGWFKEKPQLIEQGKAPLMNLPFVVDREEKRVICQTNACFEHIARQIGYWGTNDIDASRCYELLCEIYDLRDVMVKFAYGSDGSKEEAESTLKAAMNHFKKLDACLKLEKGDGSSDPVHLIGGKLSAPDFHLFEMLDQFVGLCSFYEFPDFLGELPQLQAFKAGFEKLEENQFYLKSWLHSGLPYNNCSGKFASLPGPAAYTHGESAEVAKSFRAKGAITLK